MEPDLEHSLVELARRARRAARRLAPASRESREAAVRALAARVEAATPRLLQANEDDVRAARERGLSDALIDRLRLDEGRVGAIAKSILEIAALPDPLWQTIDETERPNGLRVRRVRVPIGVIAMVYESRPNVTVEASALAIKSGNAIVLRGGSEALRSNRVFAEAAALALADAGLPKDAVQLVPTTDREAIRVLLSQTESIDLAIPRGGEALIRHVTEVARVPVIQHWKGVCHLYLDEGCDAEMAARLTFDGKLSRPGVCNALECLLVHRAHAQRGGWFGELLRTLTERGCEVRGCEETRGVFPGAKPAEEDDWGREFLAPVLAVRVVASLDDAMDHIARYGSGHTEAICTSVAAHAERFRHEIDAACVVVNASTRFHDGGELGLGAELGIATSRLHWRGAMGLLALTTMKWIVDGAGQTRH